ncbi:hypothetical protein [Nocardiopsis metallicus]|uniref:Siroheme synthase (Precorrin-2 oxidase/ferrochelatase) n=1 Tax=Nocardiopsis metallicus TaxID=179819 RepID=A0A840WWN7_9ACTN|nr:hypothetical protein [Nocardiopsis metallicus]MBB5494588.1 siroheme synthase (precorrin-2 oxidase/ferrochelatase) [Nocardiopsis metallicus]
MSLLFMLFALMGAVIVLGGGSYALRRVLAHMEARVAVAEPEPPPRAEHGNHVGGYVPIQRDPDELPAEVLSRARNLVALGRADEAVRLVRTRLGGDENRARLVVRRLGEEGRPALEP